MWGPWALWQSSWSIVSRTWSKGKKSQSLFGLRSLSFTCTPPPTFNPRRAGFFGLPICLFIIIIQYGTQNNINLDQDEEEKKPKLMCLIRLPINLTKQNCRVLTIVECTWELKTTYQKSINIQLGQWKFFNKVKIKNKFTIKYQSYPCLMQEWYKWFT